MSGFLRPRKSQQRKAFVTWYGDKNHQLGTKWIHKRQRPEVFGFAKGLILGLKGEWEHPFVLVRFWNGGEELDYVVKSENQLRPVVVRKNQNQTL